MNEPFEKLYNETVQKIYRLSLGLTGNANLAEEITQEAYFRAFQSFGKFRGESTFYTWIYRIAVNTAKQYMKEQSKLPIQALAEDFGYNIEHIVDENPQSDPETQVLWKEARYKCLHCMTECLSPEQRQIFCLAVTLNLPQKTVAEILSCSLSKVKTSLFRSRQKWFGYMENRCGFIKKSNPCNCAQWVRFGLQQGWITKKEVEYAPDLDINMRALAEVRSLRTLRDIYTVLYPSMNDSLAVRIKQGIEKNEWWIISK